MKKVAVPYAAHRAALRDALFAMFASLLAATPCQLFGQNFPAPGGMNEFSNVIIEQPNTAMVIVPGVPADTPYTEAPVTGDPAASPPPGAFAPELPETTSNYEGPIGVTGIFNGNVTTGCSYDPSSHNAHRIIDDLVVPGSLGKYPLKMTRYYNSRQQYYAGGAIGLSPGWAHEYSWLLWGAGTKVISPHGNVYDFFCSGAPPTGVSESWEGPHSDGNGTWRLADGGRVRFDNYRVKYIDDPYQLRTKIAYINDVHDPKNGQRVKVTEPGGRCLWFIYDDQNHGFDQGIEWGDWTWLLTRVEAYDADSSPGTPAPPTGNLIGWVNYTYGIRDPINPVIRNRKQKMLVRVDYPDSSADITDSTHAHYEYRTDNVPENQTIQKRYPLIQRCDDVRYGGAMRTIRYEYQNNTPHGAIINEKCPGPGAVSAIDPPPTFGPPTLDSFTETRGDGPSGQGPTRTFTYTHLRHCQGTECGPCDDYENNYPPQQMLDHYTDFQDKLTQLSYDSNWYINSVTDANGHITGYTRGSPPPAGIGEIRTITLPAGDNNTYPASTIQYTYEPEVSPTPGVTPIQGHYLKTITDENGKTTTLQRDSHYRINQIDYPQGPYTPASHEYFTYCDQAGPQCNNTFGQIKRHQLKNNAYVHYRYDSRGLLVDKWEPTSNDSAVETDPKTHYDYYTAGRWKDRLKTVTMPPNWPNSYQASETYEYDLDANSQPCAGRGLITKVTYVSPTSGISHSSSYNQYGNKIDEWNELGEHTHYSYDDYNRLRSSAKGGEITNYTYNPTNGGASPYLHTTNNPDTITSPTGILTRNVYDPNFRKISTSVAGRATTWFAYDFVGNQTCVTDPRGSGQCSTTFTTTTHYDTRNRKDYVNDAQGHPTTYTYDNASNIIRIDRPNGNWEAKAYDAVNRVIRDTVSFTGGSPAVNLETWFTYWPSGTLHTVTDPRGTVGRTYPNGDANFTTTFVYNESDQRTAMSYPPVNGNSDGQGWGYDAAHNLTSHTMPNGQIEFFAYDERNRNYGKAWWGGGSEWRWYYFGLDDASRLRDAKNGTGAVFDANTLSRVHRDYYPTGKLKLDRQALLDQPNGPGPTKVVNYEHDTQFTGAESTPTRIHITNADGSDAGYDYDFRCDDLGRWEKILVHDAALKFQYSYDPASNETLRHNDANGVDQSYLPDELNRRTKTDVQYHNGRALESYGYWENGLLHTVTRGNKQDEFTYYLDGQLKQVMYGVPQTEGISSETPPAEDPTKEKTVDDFVSMSAPDPNGVLTADRTVRYNLDYAGNRTSVVDNGTTTAYQPDSLNRYMNQVGNDAITNGSNHELISYKTNAYTYADQRLTNVMSGVNNYDLAYDALGRCVKRTLNTGQGAVTKYYIYDGERPILEYGVAGNVRGRNLYGKGIDEILMRTDYTFNPPATFYYQQDHEGSVIYLTRPDGTLLERYRYDVFGAPTIRDGDGNLLPNGSAVSNRFMFTGREYAAAFGFYEYRARAYHPGLGRFMSEDPKLFVRNAGLGKAPGDWSFAAHPDEAEFNLFRYCGNDPINRNDPFGLDSVDVFFDKVSKPQMGPLHMDPSGHVHSGQFVWKDDNGKVRFNIPVNSGGYKDRTSHNKSEETRVFAGRYKATEDLGNRTDPRMSRDGVGFSIKVVPVFKQDPNNYQTLIRIHPDGGFPGTHACLGLNADGKTLTSFRKELNNYIEKRGPLPINVQ